jgi:hypothetical protein
MEALQVGILQDLGDVVVNEEVVESVEIRNNRQSHQ